MKTMYELKNVTPADFRNAMAALASAVCVVALHHDGERLGRTVTAVLSLSLTPPRIVVSIDRLSPFIQRLEQVKNFSFFILSENQRDIADAFAGHIAPEKRFDIGDWQLDASGLSNLSNMTKPATGAGLMQFFHKILLTKSVYLG